jgi:TRAP-type C4-dicarboxylate transport system permease small subunit
MYKALEKFDDFLEKLSTWGLVISLGLMLSIASLNIVLRWFDITFLWFDPLVRHLVFLAAFLGGSLATSKGNHIRIDLAAKALEKINNPVLTRTLMTMINLVCVFALLWLVKSSLDLAKIEFEFGKIAFLGIHSGYLISIIPLGFGLIALRFIFQIVKSAIGPAPELAKDAV